MSLPTTRRGRFLYRRERYLHKLRKWDKWKNIYVRNEAGKKHKVGVKPWDPRGPLQFPAGVSSHSYDAELLFGTGFPVAFSVLEVGSKMPPHVKITEPWYLAFRAEDFHQRFALLRYHAKRVRSIRRLGGRETSALNRRITGCNWFFHYNSCFPDDDVLGRHPNQTDIDNGAPYADTLWPVPLGY